MGFGNETQEWSESSSSSLKAPMIEVAEEKKEKGEERSREKKGLGGKCLREWMGKKVAGAVRKVVGMGRGKGERGEKGDGGGRRVRVKGRIRRALRGRGEGKAEGGDGSGGWSGGVGGRKEMKRDEKEGGK